MRTAALLAAALLVPVLGGTVTAQPADARRIRVIGRGTAAAAADRATVRIGVSTRRATPAAALDETSAAVGRVVAFSKRFGVEDGDIRTASVQLQDTTDPSFPRREPPRADERFQASNTVSVRIRDLARLGEYVRDTLGAGANRISGVEFDLSDPQRIADEARVAAFRDAARRAGLLADLAGVKLGPVLHIHHPPRAEGRPPGGEAMTMRAAPAPVPIEAGTIEVAAEVDVAWQIE